MRSSRPAEKDVLSKKLEVLTQQFLSNKENKITYCTHADNAYQNGSAVPSLIVKPSSRMKKAKSEDFDDDL
jgi:hypothetical protein